jgi:8-oxo-dGTP pyrophosphatase MutT (NUDIX family)
VHHIQRKILSLLMHATTLNYAQMRPKGVESNHFAYHLDQLVQAKLVIKQDRSYSLTTEGLALVDRVSHDNITVRKQPHIVTSICITNDAGQTLLFKHAFQPYLNLVGFVQGRLHFEETIAEAARRELLEKTGLQDIKLTHRGMAYIHATKQGASISKILVHDFEGTVKGTPPLISNDPQKGTPTWGDATAYAEHECMPGFGEINKLLNQSTRLFFAEIETEMK